MWQTVRRLVADGEPADLAGRLEVALHDDRGHEQQVGDVVEAAADVVGRQQQVDAELARQLLETEQVANGVAVLGARQAVHERE